MENTKYEQKAGDCAFFSPKNENPLSGDGYVINEDGKRINALMQKVSLPTGRVVRRVFIEVGAVFENENDNPKAPIFTGKVEIAGLSTATKMSLWAQSPKSGGDKFLTGKIDEPMIRQSNDSGSSL